MDMKRNQNHSDTKKSMWMERDGKCECKWLKWQSSDTLKVNRHACTDTQHTRSWKQSIGFFYTLEDVHVRMNFWFEHRWKWIRKYDTQTQRFKTMHTSTKICATNKLKHATKCFSVKQQQKQQKQQKRIEKQKCKDREGKKRNRTPTEKWHVYKKLNWTRKNLSLTSMSLLVCVFWCNTLDETTSKCLFWAKHTSIRMNLVFRFVFT